MTYISMLRGINVGGQKIIKMNDLKFLYESLGFDDVVCYIQTGNVIFDSPEKNKNILKTNIEKVIQQKYKFQVAVFIRTKQEFATIINNCPYVPVDSATNGTKILITFLSAISSKYTLADTLQNVVAPDKMIIKGKQLYLFCPNGYGKSKLANNLIEKKLGLDATTRNWKSIQKLHELATE